MNIKGWTRVEADASGQLKLPDGITIQNTLRTHTTRHYTETGKDNVGITLDIYTWYAKNVRHPVFESIKTTLHSSRSSGRRGRDEVSEEEVKNKAIFYISFYYAPEELTEQTDLLNSDIDIYGNPIPEAEKIFTEARMLPNPVVSNLNIDYRLMRQAQIWFSVHNNIGIPMRQTNPQALNEGYHQTQIPMSGLVTGTYIIYVHVDDLVIRRAVVKK